MAYPADLKYTKDHEWMRVSGDVAEVGITDYAQEQLGDVVYVDLPAAGATVTQFEKMGEIESVKAVSDLYAPIGGEVVSTNGAVSDTPELVNSDAHGDGWLLEVRLADGAQIDALMTAAEYDAFIAAEANDEAIGP